MYSAVCTLCVASASLSKSLPPPVPRINAIDVSTSVGITMVAVMCSDVSSDSGWGCNDADNDAATTPGATVVVAVVVVVGSIQYGVVSSSSADASAHVDDGTQLVTHTSIVWCIGISYDGRVCVLCILACVCVLCAGAGACACKR